MITVQGLNATAFVDRVRPLLEAKDLPGLVSLVKSSYSAEQLLGWRAQTPFDDVETPLCSGVGVMIVMAVATAACSLWRAVSVGVFSVVHHSLRRL